MVRFLKGSAGLLTLIIFVYAIFYLVFLGGAASESKTNISPDVPGLVPNEISITRAVMSFPIPQRISFQWNYDNLQEVIIKKDDDGTKILIGAIYDEKTRRIVSIETENCVFNYSDESKGWVVRSKNADITYEREVPPDNQYLKDSIARAKELVAYAHKRFRKTLLKYGVLGAEKSDGS
jgi:hypothetical protein